MTTKTRDMLRSSVLETLLKTFPGSQIVKGGMAFVSDQIDEDTGVPLAVVLSITVPLTADTARSKAFDFDAAVADAKNAPGRRVADPVKKAEKEAKAAESKARERKNLAALTEWIEKGGLGEGMTPGTVHSHAAEIGLDVATPMMTGSLLKKLAEAGEKPFDFLFIDAAKSHYKRFLDAAMPLTHPGSVIVSDNVLFRGSVAEDEEHLDRRHKTNIRRLQEYMEYIYHHPALETSLIACGDGLAISRVREKNQI